MIIRYEISLQKRKKKVRNHVCMFGVVERRKGDLSAQVGRRVMCVVQVSKKFPPPMMKGENSPSSPPDGRTLLGQFSPFIIDGADFAWTGLDSRHGATHTTRRPTCAERSPVRLATDSETFNNSKHANMVLDLFFFFEVIFHI